MTLPVPPSPDANVYVELPFHLRALARVGPAEHPLLLSVPGPPTLEAVLTVLETRFPMLRGTIRDHLTLARRPFLRFFAGQADISHLPLHTLLPPAVACGEEPLIILGAVAGGLQLTLPENVITFHP